MRASKNIVKQTNKTKNEGIRPSTNQLMFFHNQIFFCKMTPILSLTEKHVQTNSQHDRRLWKHRPPWNNLQCSCGPTPRAVNIDLPNSSSNQLRLLNKEEKLQTSVGTLSRRTGNKHFICSCMVCLNFFVVPRKKSQEEVWPDEVFSFLYFTILIWPSDWQQFCCKTPSQCLYGLVVFICLLWVFVFQGQGPVMIVQSCFFFFQGMRISSLKTSVRVCHRQILSRLHFKSELLHLGHPTSQFNFILK